MSNWKDRLEKEKDELESRIESLDLFMLSSEFEDLEPTDTELLVQQSEIMEFYLETLVHRLHKIGVREADLIDRVFDAKNVFEEAIESHLETNREEEITPLSLLELGFLEVYQESDVRVASVGFIYYSLTLMDVEFLSSSLGEDVGFHVMFGNECQFEVHSLRKLKDLILSLKELKCK
tara:strand:- start:14119 stop:14652 length:534 start_codon:yes stop_codon:yes gene_type:complete